MKMNAQLATELAQLIGQLFHDAPEYTPVPEYRFIAYRRGNGQIISGSEQDIPYFITNQQDSEKQSFLQKARQSLATFIQFFNSITPEASVSRYPGIHQALATLKRVEPEFDRLASLDQVAYTDDPVPEPWEPRPIYFGYGLLPGQEQHDSAVFEALCDFFVITLQPYLYSPLPVKEGGADQEASKDPPTRRGLFPNSNTINLTSQFGMPKFIADNINRVIRQVNPQQAIQQFRNDRKGSYKIQNRETETEFVFDKEKLAIKTAEQFAEKLGKLKDAKVIQTYFALMKWINLKDTPVFHNVPISDIMALVLKSQGDNKFNTAARREFSEALEYLTNVSITVTVIGEKVNKKTGNRKAVLQQENGVRLFRMVAEYSVKKQFQSIPKEALIEDIHFDKTVINHFSGEILPGNQRLFGQRGAVYFDTLLQLDVNRDSKAILMGFAVQTRFNQMLDKERFIEMDRASLIELCDYQKTNQTKPSQATKQLANNFDKLKKAGIISKCDGLTNNDSDRVRIYPSMAIKGEIAS